MEKRTAHYSLALIKKMIEEGHYDITLSARSTAAADFAFKTEEITSTIQSLTHHSFYKSMTTHHNHRLWQDVYKPQIRGNTAYIKLQIANESTVIISFKRGSEP